MFTLIAALTAIRNPQRADMVAAVCEKTSLHALRKLRLRMMDSESGRRILMEKPIITETTMNEASCMAENSLGKLYHNFMQEHKFKPSERPKVYFIEDPELKYIMTRYRQIHDFLHIIYGVPISVRGELALKLIEFKETRFPSPLLGVLAAPLMLPYSELKLFLPDVLWALNQNSRFMDVYFEEMLPLPVEDVRRRVAAQWSSGMILP